MGIVYKARQMGLNRIVALKMIRAGRYAEPGELARFRQEAEAVARLQHPHIVQIHEIGTADGRPYFSLEYVEGGSLAGKLNGAPLPAPLAARLLEALAGAVHYAHERGVIHRDLKPHNVLLSFSGGSQNRAGPPQAPFCEPPLNEVVPKVADFGLAKQLDGGESQTETGAILGTPSYMAPEQAWGKTKIGSIGPAADVWALGAILYECLTGRPPFRGESAVDTLQQVVDQEPVPPSRLNPKVPRDLETICLKCLQKAPARRYPSAGALGEDLGRFRRGEPIQARPVGRLERAWRWCRRNRLAASLAVGLVLVFLAGFGGVLWEWRQAVLHERDALRARDEANKERTKADAAAAKAEKEGTRASKAAAKAEAINNFLINDLLKAPRPDELGRAVTLRQALDAAEPRIARAFAAQPEVEASLRGTLGKSYFLLGALPPAEKQFRKALAIYRRALPADDPRTLLAINDLATLLQEQCKYDQAEALHREALDGLTRVRGPDHEETLIAVHNLATMLYYQGKLAEAEPHMRHVLKVCLRKLGPTHKETLQARISLVAVLSRQNKLAEAERLCRPLVKDCERTLGPLDTNTLAATSILGLLLTNLNRLKESEKVHRRLVASCEKKLGPEHPNTQIARHKLAAVLLEQGKTTEAESMCRKALETRRKVLRTGHPDTAATQALLGEILLERRQPKVAEPLLRAALVILRKELPKGNAQTGETLSLLGRCLAEQARYKDGEPLLLEGYQVLKAAQGVPPRRLRAVAQWVVRLYEGWGKSGEAARWRKKLPSR
jgi:tetratricopeptide (TPR) repeat protein